MTYEALISNLEQIKNIIREIYVFTNQLDVIKNLESDTKVVINVKEKRLLNNAIFSLTNQLVILNNSIPELLGAVGFYKKLDAKERGVEPAIAAKPAPLSLASKSMLPKKFIKVQYKPALEKAPVSLTISKQDRTAFLENLSKSYLSINQLKKKYAVEKPIATFGKPNAYAKISNHFFRNLSSKLVSQGYFKKLNNSLRQMNSPFVVGTYVSMIFFTVLISLIAGILLFILLLFFNINLTFPFLTFLEENILLRTAKVFWVILAIPVITGILMYFYPLSEGKNLGARMDQELPFIAIHMSAVATSGIEPTNIFKIILKSEEYKYTRVEFRKLINLINFHGKDLVTALKKTAQVSPSNKLKELLEGMATTITSGGDLHEFLNKHAESLLFDHRLEREKYIKISETFMDIYISIVIAAPMILLMLFVIMGSTGALSNFIGLSIDTLGFLIILAIVALNLGFLVFLKLKQPVI